MQLFVNVLMNSWLSMYAGTISLIFPEIFEGLKLHILISHIWITTHL